MARNPALSIGLLIASLTAGVPAAAQSLPDHPWSHGTTLGVFGGSATASETQGTLGAMLGWEINRRVAIEGTGAWVVPRDGDKAFAAELTVLANLTRPNTVVPFVAGGVGMYLATFDSAAGPLPPFYQHRVTPSYGGGPISFTDPSLVVAAGIDIFAGSHLSFRPEVSMRTVLDNSDSYKVTMVTLRATYHFERHTLPR